MGCQSRRLLLGLRLRFVLHLPACRSQNTVCVRGVLLPFNRPRQRLRVSCRMHSAWLQHCTDQLLPAKVHANRCTQSLRSDVAIQFDFALTASPGCRAAVNASPPPS